MTRLRMSIAAMRPVFESLCAVGDFARRSPWLTETMRSFLSGASRRRRPELAAAPLSARSTSASTAHPIGEAAAKVSDYALKEAAYLVARGQMLSEPLRGLREHYDP